MPPTDDIVRIIEAIGDQVVRVEVAQNFSGLCIFMTIWCVSLGSLGMGLWIAKKLGAFK